MSDSDLGPGLSASIADSPFFMFETPCKPSDRELEVLRWAALGLSDQEIADLMFLHIATVKAHLFRCRQKLHALNTTHAVALALWRKFITLAD